MSMDIYSPTGTKVKFLDENGYEFDKSAARRFFSKGQTLTVKTIAVGGWVSYVEFEECPGKMFNTVMFTEAAHD
jgi:hypothetical protein